MQFLEAPVSGSRKQAATAERVVADKQMDLVMIGLAHLANPNWAYQAAKALTKDKPSWVLLAPYAHWLERYSAA